MTTYKLIYEDDRHGVAKRIEFEAANATGALKIAGREAQGRWAQLFEGERFVCRIERIDPDGANIWIVAPQTGMRGDEPAPGTVTKGAEVEERPAIPGTRQ